MSEAAEHSWIWSVFTFSGRVGRASYWLRWLGVLLTFATLSAAAFDLGGIDPRTGVVIVILAFPTVRAGMALTVRRLHDRNKSGWWLLLFAVVPAALDKVAEATAPAGAVLAAISLGVSLYYFVEVGCLRGTIGENRYGPDPVEAQPGIDRTTARRRDPPPLMDQR